MTVAANKERVNSYLHFQSKPLTKLNMGLDARKPVFDGLRITKAQDKPVQMSSLISAFVICFLESIISRLATSQISNF